MREEPGGAGKSRGAVPKIGPKGGCSGIFGACLGAIIPRALFISYLADGQQFRTKIMHLVITNP